MNGMTREWRPYNKRNKSLLTVRTKRFEMGEGVYLNTNLTIRLGDIQGPNAEIRLRMTLTENWRTLAAYEKAFPRDDFSFEAYEAFLAEFLKNPAIRGQYQVPVTRKGA